MARSSNLPHRKLLILGDASLFERMEAARVGRCDLFLATLLPDATRVLHAHPDLSLVLISPQAGAGSLATLARQRPGLRAVVLTSDRWLAREARGLQLGSVACLLPDNASAERLREAVRSALDEIEAGRAAPAAPPPAGSGEVHEAGAPWGGTTEDGLDLRADWLQVIAHDLRTPLSIHNSYLALLLGRDSPDAHERRDILERMQAVGEWMLEMVDGMLDLARQRAGALRFNIQPTSLDTILDGVVLRMQGFAEMHGVTLERSRGREAKLYDLDGPRVEQVLQNLVINAIKASPPGSAVHVKVQASRGKLSFSVGDQGRGMTPEEIAQALGETAMAGGRRGLGLAICKAIVELHGGRLWATSEPGAGTTFYFTVVPEAAHATARGTRPAARRPRSRAQP